LPEQKQELITISDQVGKKDFNELEHQEKDIIRLMLMYGSLGIPLEIENEEGEIIEEKYPLAQFVIEEMVTDNLSYKNESYQKIFNEFLDGLENGLVINDQQFLQNEDQSLNSLVVDLTTSRNVLSENWATKHNIFTKTEPKRLKRAVMESVSIFKLRVTENLIYEKQQLLKSEVKENETLNILKDIKQLTDVRNIFAKDLGIIITR
jgi:hypothetical protein